MNRPFGFKIVVPLIAIAGLSMGNQGCEPEKGRALKMSVELGTLKGRVVKLPNGESIDFPYVANSLFYRQVFNHDHFVMINPVPSVSNLVSSGGVFKTASAKLTASGDQLPAGMVSQKDIDALEKYGFMDQIRGEAASVMNGSKSLKEVVEGKATFEKVESLPACLYESPQAVLGGEIISFEANWGVGVGVGYNAGGELAGSVGGSVNFNSSKLELGLRTDDPLSLRLLAIGDGISRQSTVNFGINFVPGVPIGLDFFYKTPITDVIRSGLTDGLDQIVDTYKRTAANQDWNMVWEARVLYNPAIADGDTHIAINAGSLAGLQVGDTFTVTNMHYEWEGAACYTRLKYSIATTRTPVAEVKIVTVAPNISVAEVTKYIIEAGIQPGAQVKLLKFYEVPKPDTASTAKAPVVTP